MVKEHARKPLAWSALTIAALLLGATVTVAATDLHSGVPGQNRSPEFLLYGGLAALSAAAGVKLLSVERVTPKRVPYRRAAVPAQRPSPEKGISWFHSTIGAMLDPTGQCAEKAVEELKNQLRRATEGHPENCTVALLEQLLYQRLEGRKVKLPLLKPAFFRVRDALRATLPIGRRPIRPSSRLDDLFPREARQEAWAGFFGRLQVTPLSLEAPYVTRWIFVLLTLPFWCLLTVFVEKPGHDVAALMTLAATVGLFYLFPQALRKSRFAQEIPTDCQTVRQLVERYTPRELASEVPWDVKRVRERTRVILAQVAGMSPGDVRPDMRLDTDFGISVGSGETSSAV